jgi:hypothetical protein
MQKEFYKLYKLSRILLCAFEFMYGVISFKAQLMCPIL